MKKIGYLSLLSALIPSITFGALDGLKSLLDEIFLLLKGVYPIVIILAVIYFMWGVAKFIKNDAGSDKTREEGKQRMLWGLIALFIIFGVWGILQMVSNTIGVKIKAPDQVENVLKSEN